VEQRAEGIRWGRVILAAVIVEIALALVTAPVALLSATPAETANTIIPPASFIVVLLVALALFRHTERPVANGIAAGIASLALYVLLLLAAYGVAPEQTNFEQSLGLPVIASYVLRILGGAAGGWWVQRNRGAPAS